MQETRKVQETHKRTLIISLPKKWLRRFPVQGGDHVVLSLQADGALLVRPSVAVDLALPRIRASEGTAQALSRISGLYVGGAPGIVVEDCAHDQVAALRAHVLSFIGAEMVEEAGGALTVQFLGNEARFTATRALQRLWTLAQDNLSGQAVEPAEVQRIHSYLLRHVGRALADPAAAAATETVSLVRAADAIAMVASCHVQQSDAACAPLLASAVDAYLSRDADAVRGLIATPALGRPAGLVASAARTVAMATLMHA